MQRQQRHILLLIDNAPTHTILEPSQLTNITIHSLPPNTTSHLQPCDAGIIKSFKTSTKANWFVTWIKLKILPCVGTHIADSYDLSRELNSNIIPVNILDAITYCAEA